MASAKAFFFSSCASQQHCFNVGGKGLFTPEFLQQADRGNYVPLAITRCTGQVDYDVAAGVIFGEGNNVADGVGIAEEAAESGETEDTADVGQNMEASAVEAEWHRVNLFICSINSPI